MQFYAVVLVLVLSAIISLPTAFILLKFTQFLTRILVNRVRGENVTNRRGLARKIF